MRNSPHSPSRIILVGPMGAGKTSIGRLIAARMQCVFVDLDTCIAAEAGTTITSIFATEGEAGFRSRECRAFSDALASAEASVIATGGGAVLDEGNRRTMRDAGTVVYLQVEPGTQLQRLQGDGTRPLLAAENPAQRLAELQAIREPLYRDVADVVFDTTQYSLESAVERLSVLLQSSERLE